MAATDIAKGMQRASNLAVLEQWANAAKSCSAADRESMRDVYVARRKQLTELCVKSARCSFEQRQVEPMPDNAQMLADLQNQVSIFFGPGGIDPASYSTLVPGLTDACKFADLDVKGLEGLLAFLMAGYKA